MCGSFDEFEVWEGCSSLGGIEVCEELKFGKGRVGWKGRRPILNGLELAGIKFERTLKWKGAEVLGAERDGAEGGGIVRTSRCACTSFLNQSIQDLVPAIHKLTCRPKKCTKC